MTTLNFYYEEDIPIWEHPDEGAASTEDYELISEEFRTLIEAHPEFKGWTHEGVCGRCGEDNGKGGTELWNYPCDKCDWLESKPSICDVVYECSVCYAEFDTYASATQHQTTCGGQMECFHPNENEL